VLFVDLYCERVGPGLWAEPLNALTNVAYLAAAWAVWRRPGQSSRGLRRVLSALLVAIAAGSALFHTTATPVARLFDEAPILLFQLTFLWAYGRRVMSLTSPVAGGVIVGFLIATVAARQFGHLLNGSLAYAPALCLAFGLGVYHRRTETRERSMLLAGACCLAVGVVLRTIDNTVCPAFPVGTHFLWHVLTAGALYLFSCGLVVPLDRRDVGA
jgi:hypothetical protein